MIGGWKKKGKQKNRFSISSHQAQPPQPHARGHPRPPPRARQREARQSCHRTGSSPRQQWPGLGGGKGAKAAGRPTTPTPAHTSSTPPPRAQPAGRRPTPPGRGQQAGQRGGAAAAGAPRGCRAATTGGAQAATSAATQAAAALADRPGWGGAAAPPVKVAFISTATMNSPFGGARAAGGGRGGGSGSRHPAPPLLPIQAHTLHPPPPRPILQPHPPTRVQGLIRQGVRDPVGRPEDVGGGEPGKARAQGPAPVARGGQGFHLGRPAPFQLVDD